MIGHKTTTVSINDTSLTPQQVFALRMAVSALATDVINMGAELGELRAPLYARLGEIMKLMDDVEVESCT